MPVVILDANDFFLILSDQWHGDGEPLLDRCQEANRKVKGQAKNGCSEGRQSHTAEHPWPRRQHSFSKRLWQRWWEGGVKWLGSATPGLSLGLCGHLVTELGFCLWPRHFRYPFSGLRPFQSIARQASQQPLSLSRQTIWALRPLQTLPPSNQQWQVRLASTDMNI